MRGREEYWEEEGEERIGEENGRGLYIIIVYV